MLTYQQVMIDSHKITNVVVPQVIQVHQIIRQPAFTTSIKYPQPSMTLISNNAYSINNAFTVRPPFKSMPNLLTKNITSPQHNKSTKVVLLKTIEDTQNTTLKNNLHSQLNKLFVKLETIDHSLNELTNDVHRIGSTKMKKSQLRSVNEDAGSTKIDFSQGNGTFHTPAKQGNNNIKIQSGQSRDIMFKESQINEILSRIQLVKGTQFGDYFYFGELNESGFRAGYGALYDQNGRIIYCGYWHNDRYHNRGKLYFYDKKRSHIEMSSFEVQSRVAQNAISYTGQFTMGEMNGLGQMMFATLGSERFVYYGRFVDGVFHGRATVIDYTHDIDTEDTLIGYEGLWSNGRQIRGRQYSPKRPVHSPLYRTQNLTNQVIDTKSNRTKTVIETKTQVSSQQNYMKRQVG